MEKKNINVKIEKSVAQGEYANLVLSVFSPSEFIFDFAKLLPGVDEANVHTRIIMTPAHAKMFLKSLQDSMEKFENTHGPIKAGEENGKQIGFTKG